MLLPTLAILLATACKDSSNSSGSGTAGNQAADRPTVLVPVQMPYQVLQQYPHDTKAFTEGLEWHNGALYESTGQYGSSSVRKVEITTGKVLQEQKLDDKYFGEGLTIMGDKLYQLTYREGKGFVYDLATLKPMGTFFFSSPEGWGMTNNGAELIYNAGTDKIFFADPATGAILRTLDVTDEHGPVQMINEMELIHGYIYANQWQTDLILKIDTTSGKVVARADLSGLRASAGIPQPDGRRGDPDVLNGIAYDPTGNHIYITGKNWPKLFEIRLDN